MNLFKHSSPQQNPAAENSNPVLLSENGLPQTSTTNQTMIVEGDQHNFMQEVLESSKQIPVLVDFWATWCEPCKQLTPILEKIIQNAQGRLKLVKLDIDANKMLVQQLMQVGLPIQSIPLVAAFWNGQIVDLFQGVQPENTIQQFVDHLLKSAGSAMPSVDLIGAGQKALANAKFEEAMANFSQVLETEPQKPEAWGGLIRAILAYSGPEDATETWDQVPSEIKEHPEVTGAKAAIDLALEGEKTKTEADQLLEKVQSNPEDYQARYELSSALNAVGKKKEAAEQLLEIIRKDRQWNEEAARKQLLRLFEAWGFDDPITLEARRALSNLLFS